MAKNVTTILIIIVCFNLYSTGKSRHTVAYFVFQVIHINVMPHVVNDSLKSVIHFWILPGDMDRILYHNMDPLIISIRKDSV